jgi:ribonuclease R
MNIRFDDEFFEQLKNVMSASDYRPLRFKELCYLYDVNTEEEKETFLEWLSQLCDEVKRVKTKNNRYMLPPKGMLTGI